MPSPIKNENTRKLKIGGGPLARLVNRLLGDVEAGRIEGLRRQIVRLMRHPHPWRRAFRVLQSPATRDDGGSRRPFQPDGL
jgi:hypothetical protein